MLIYQMLSWYFNEHINILINRHPLRHFIMKIMHSLNYGNQINSSVQNHSIPDLILSWLAVNPVFLLQVLTNGKYKSHIHQVAVDNNKVRRISLATLHGPSLDTFVIPATKFVDHFHPLGYRGMTYKESLEANGHHEIEVQSCLEQLRLWTNK